MADKYLYLDPANSTVTEMEATVTSAGAGDAGEIIALGADGKIDPSLLPTGIAADTASIQASENLAAGDLVNIHNSSGARIRKADATTAGKEAHGFVLAAVTSGQPGTVYFEGTNAQVTGLTPGVVFLSTTPGIASGTAPSAAGNVVQRVGVATAATSLNAEFGLPIVLA